jgi:hypothetical protein
MKKYFVAYLLLFSLVACKKDSDKAMQFKNTAWSGSYEDLQQYQHCPFLLNFTSDSTVQFHDLSGIYDGSFAYSDANKMVDIKFPGVTPDFTGIVSGDTLKEILNNSVYKFIRNCGLNNSTDQKLKDIEYTGHILRQAWYTPIKVKFPSENACEINVNGAGYVPVTEFQRNSGTIRFKFDFDNWNERFFGIIDGETIKGTLFLGSVFLKK